MQHFILASAIFPCYNYHSPPYMNIIVQRTLIHASKKQPFVLISKDTIYTEKKNNINM